MFNIEDLDELGEPYSIKYYGLNRSNSIKKIYNNYGSNQNKKLIVYQDKDSNIVYKVKVYYDTNELKYIILYDKHELFHHDKYPAVVYYYKNIHVKKEIYYRHGLQHRVNDLPAIIERYDNSDISKLTYKLNNKVHRDHDKPAVIHYHPNGKESLLLYLVDGNFFRIGDNPTYIEYYDNGLIKLLKYTLNNALHRDNKPAVISYHNNGNVSNEIYMQNNKYHRYNNPAIIEYYDTGDPKKYMFYYEGLIVNSNKYPSEIQYYKNQNVYIKKFFINGKLHSINDTPAYIEYYEDGKLKLEQYYLNGKLHRDYDKPAEIKYYNSGNIQSVSFYKNNLLDRQNEPAHIVYYENGNIDTKEYYKEQNLYSYNYNHSIIQYNSTGDVIKEEYHSNNQKYDTKFDLILYTPINLDYFNNFSQSDTNNFFKHHNTELLQLFTKTDMDSEALESIDRIIYIVFNLKYLPWIIICLKYMIYCKTYSSISRFYEDKSLKIFTDGSLDYLRLFNAYDFAMTPSNYTQLLFLFNNDWNQIYIPNILTDINPNLIFKEEIPISFETDNEHFNKYLLPTKLNLFVCTDKKDYLPISDINQSYLDCCENFYANNISLSNNLSFYSKHGDNCMHNLLRNMKHLNTIEYCMGYNNDDVLHILYELNNNIWESSFNCHRDSDIILYRGSNFSKTKWEKGTIISDMQLRFVSFSRMYNIAFNFGKIVYKLLLTPKDICIPIEKLKSQQTFISAYPHELEWLLPLNTIFEIYEEPFSIQHIFEKDTPSEKIHNHIVIPIRIVRQEFTPYVDIQ